MITDYHVHLETGPYTINWLMKYLEIANERGVTDLGFSEHGYRFKQSKAILFNPWIEERQTEDVDEYVSLILEAKKRGLPVKLGIELDYFPGKEKEIEQFLAPYPWDYVIGSVHWLDDWGFDLIEMREQWNQRAILEAYQEYFSRVELLLDTKQFDILGHVDVIKVFGYRPSEDEHETLYSLYDRVVEKIAQSGITVEMSTAGLRKPVQELYPAPALMEKLAKYNIPMIINSDAHRPEHVGADYDIGIKYLKEYGIDQISTFEKRKRKIVHLG
ncbi:MAG: histidinol-phosphatase HisJ family protein [Tepidibacillus sp.]